MLKAVVLIGGPQKGTRFRPLSLDIPKPLFPVAGLPLIQHHIEACTAIKDVKEILIIGFYPITQIQQFINDMQLQYSITIKYLQEFTALGTAGGLFHFRDQIRSGSPNAFFVMNGDVCADFPLRELYQFHEERSSTALVSIMSTEATRPQSLNYGCMVIDKNKNEVTHYVEKPSSYVSTLINCGVYVFSPKIFNMIGEQFNARQEEYYNGVEIATATAVGPISGGRNTQFNVCINKDIRSDNGNASKDAGYLQLEQDILTSLAGTGKMFALPIINWWSQLKTASSAIYANRHYLELYRSKHPERLATGKQADRCTIIPDVHIDPSAIVHSTAVIGPNVSIGPGVNIGAGVRIRESIILDAAIIEERSLIMHSIIGRNSRVGKWARVEGTPCDPDPNKPFAKMENPRLFNNDGRLNPSITILGCSVSVPSETILLNSIVLPNKELSRSIKNEIIL